MELDELTESEKLELESLNIYTAEIEVQCIFITNKDKLENYDKWELKKYLEEECNNIHSSEIHTYPMKLIPYGRGEELPYYLEAEEISKSLKDLTISEIIKMKKELEFQKTREGSNDEQLKMDI